MEPKLFLMKCPSCGANVSLEPGKASTTCEYCDTEVVVEGKTTDSGSLFPFFSKHPVECPSCDKKALRPRVRTADFRCQACGAIRERTDIEARARREIDLELITLVLGKVWRGIISRNPRPEEPSQPWEPASEEPDSAAAQFLGSIGGLAAGYLVFRFLDGWSGLWRWLLAILAAGAGFGLGTVPFTMASESRKARSLKAQEARYAARMAEMTQWEREHASLLALWPEFGVQGASISLNQLAKKWLDDPQTRALMDAVVDSHGVPDRDDYERLKKHLGERS